MGFQIDRYICQKFEKSLFLPSDSDFFIVLSSL